jgi:DNA-binding HxlR family transcriptional regulator
MILQFGIEFKEAYELLVSAWAGAFAKQPGMLGLSRDWFNWCTTKLSAQNLTLLEEIRRMEQAIPVALALNSPNPTAVGFIKWVNSLSGSDAYEIIYSFDPNAQRKTPQVLRKLCQTLGRGLGMWYDQYFHRIAPKITAALETSAAQAHALLESFDERPQDLIKELTQSLVWEALAATDITMIPQAHLSPWPVYLIGGDHGVVFYPVAGILPQEDKSAEVERLLKALADPSRMNLLRLIGSDVARFTDLVEKSGLAKSTVHHHLVALRHAGLLWLHVGDDTAARFSVRWEAVRSLSSQLEGVLLGK